MAEHYKILVLFDLAHQRVHAGKVFVDLSVNQRNQERALDLFNTVKRLLVVVDIDERSDHPLIFVFLDIMV